MEPEFWHQRWHSHEIGFHRSDANPHLIRFWPDLQLAAGSTVLVPLCGKSHDLLWLARRGHQVIGVELSPIAVAAFFEEHGLSPQRERLDNDLECWRHESVSICCGDFFQLRADHLPDIHSIYDRAALIALPAPQRHAYVQHLHALSDAPGLLITLEYDQSILSGPPFAVLEDEVKQLHGSRYQVTCKHQQDDLQNSPRLRERGLSWLEEKVYLLHPRTPRADGA